MYKKLVVLLTVLYFSIADAFFPLWINMFINNYNQQTHRTDIPKLPLQETYDCEILKKDFDYLLKDQQNIDVTLDNLMQTKSTLQNSCLNKKIAALICFGANPNWKNGHYNLFDHAKKSDDNQLVTLLLEHNTSTNDDIS